MKTTLLASALTFLGGAGLVRGTAAAAPREGAVVLQTRGRHHHYGGPQVRIYIGIPGGYGYFPRYRSGYRYHPSYRGYYYRDHRYARPYRYYSYRPRGHQYRPYGGHSYRPYGNSGFRFQGQVIVR